ncbi:MAG: serine hydrolase [Spirosomataceae bacterium]
MRRNLLLMSLLAFGTWSKVFTQPSVVVGDTCKKIDQYLSKLAAEEHFSGAVLIIKGQQKILSKGYGWANREAKIPFTTHTLASIGSITKAFTAAAILNLVEQKKLRLSDPLSKFFTTVPADKAGITIHQLLTHSAGFHEFLKQDGGDYEKITTNDFLKRAFDEPLAFMPGQKAVYTNVGFSILGIIIEQVTGLDYEQFLKATVLKPLGIKHIGYHYPTVTSDTIAVGYQQGNKWGTIQERFAQAGGGPYWNLKANGGLEVSTDEMFTWLNSFTNHKVLSKASIDLMFSPLVLEEGYNGQSWFGYGCNVSKSRRNTKAISNGGSNGIYFARIARLPEEGLIFYVVTNESSMNANLILPNISQLYFDGKIEQDARLNQPQFENPQSEKVYSIVSKSSVSDLATELTKQNIQDDMILLEVGQKLMVEGNYAKALILYKYYTQAFPTIVVAWNDLGDVYLAQGNKDEALKCYKQALVLRPNNQRAKQNIERLSSN